MRQISDEDLLDHWNIYGPDGMIEVTEETALALRDFINLHTYTVKNERTDDVERVFVAPYLWDFVDLFGSASHIRIDQVYLINHFSPEARAMNRRHEALMQGEEKEDKPFDV